MLSALTAVLVHPGDTVRTAKIVGYVGETYRAARCHLHFEQWTAPGWWCCGGRAIDPVPASSAGIGGSRVLSTIDHPRVNRRAGS